NPAIRGPWNDSAGDCLQPDPAGKDCSERTTTTAQTADRSLEAQVGRGAGVSSCDAFGATRGEPPGDLDRAHEDVSCPPEEIRSAAALRRESHRGTRAQAGCTSRRGDCGGKISRAAARYPVGPERSL